MEQKNILFIKEGERIPQHIKFPNEFIDRGVNCFVGVYHDAESNLTIIGVPKYYLKSVTNIVSKEQIAILKHMRLICNMIEKFRLESNCADYRFSPFAQNNEIVVNKLELAEYLIRDYIENGLYGQFQTRYVIDGTGINDWGKTVERQTPMIDGDNIIYNPIIGRKSEYNYNDEITAIHVAVLREAIGLIAWDDYSNVEIPLDVDYELVYENDLELCVSALTNRLNVSFIERDKNLIKGLIAWCGLTVNNEKYYIGSTSYEHIWEMAIDKVFGNIFNKKSGVPSYFCFLDGQYKQYESRGELIPDSLRVEENNNYFHIFDAKYYVLKLKDSEMIIEGAPPSSDISKQIGYYRYLLNLYGNATRIYTNSFLIPEKSIVEGDKLIKYWGYTQQNSKRNLEIEEKIFNMPQNVDLEKVTVFDVNPTKLYKMCIAEKKITEKDLDDIFSFL